MAMYFYAALLFYDVIEFVFADGQNYALDFFTRTVAFVFGESQINFAVFRQAVEKLGKYSVRSVFLHNVGRIYESLHTLFRSVHIFFGSPRQ